jgi:hypothetical protein
MIAQMFYRCQVADVKNMMRDGQFRAGEERNIKQGLVALLCSDSIEFCED